MRRGYTVVWRGWQGDLLPGDDRRILDLPVATDGSQPITGPVRVEFIADQPGLTTFPLSGRASTRSHPTVSLDTTRASLTRRRYPNDARIEVPAADWLFARVEGGSGLDNQGAERAIVPSDTHIHVPAGFETGWIYELVYEAKDPLVLGLGHVAVRDFISFLKYEDESCRRTRQSVARDNRAASRRPMAGGARRAGAASAISSIPASTRTRGAGACSMACCRMWRAPA